MHRYVRGRVILRATMTRRLSLVLLVVLLAAPRPLTAGELEGTSGPLAWRAVDFRRGTQVIDGKENETYEVTLVVKNTTLTALTLSGYGVKASYTGFQIPERTAAGNWRLEPGGALAVPLQLSFVCASGPGRCQAASGPTWTVALSGADARGAALRAAIEFTVPLERSAPVVSPQRVVVRSVRPGVSGAGSVVPITIVHNLVLVPAVANGRDITLLLDTGAQFTALTPESARRLGVAQSTEGSTLPMIGVGAAVSEVPVISLASLRVGDHVAENLRVVVTPVLPATTMLVDGLLGADFLETFRMTVDRKSKQLRLEPNP